MILTYILLIFKKKGLKSLLKNSLRGAKMTFEANNINCQNCANTIISELKEDFGEIKVDFSVSPRRVSVELDESKEQSFKEAMSELGFDVIKRID